MISAPPSTLHFLNLGYGNNRFGCVNYAKLLLGRKEQKKWPSLALRTTLCCPCSCRIMFSIGICKKNGSCCQTGILRTVPLKFVFIHSNTPLQNIVIGAILLILKTLNKTCCPPSLKRAKVFPHKKSRNYAVTTQNCKAKSK